MNKPALIWVLAFLTLAERSPADPLNQWTWRFPRPQGYTLSAVSYGGGQFVAVGDNGSIVTSTDGYHWASQTFSVFPYLRGVAYADGEFAAIGDGGAIVVSSNGQNWTQIPLVTTNTLRGIAGNSGWLTNGLPQFFAVGDSGAAIVCRSGTNWSSVDSPATNSLKGVAGVGLGNEVQNFFVAVGDRGTVVLYAFNPWLWPVEFWFQQNSGSTNNLYAVAAAPNGILSIVGDLNAWLVLGNNVYYTNGILFSLDLGGTWQSQMWNGLYGLPNVWFPSSTFVLHSLAGGPDGFIAGGDTGYTIEYCYPGVVFSSGNGTNWTELDATTSENRVYGAVYGNGVYVLVGDAGGIVVSSNLVDWTEATDYHRSAIAAVVCSDNLCLASGLPMTHVYSTFPDFTMLRSTNGADWSPSTSPLPTMVDLAAGGGQFVGVSQNSIYTTTDGQIWQSNSSFTNAFHGIGYVNGRFIAVGDNGSVFSSTDATNWSNNSAVTSGSLRSIAYGNGVYTAAGSVGATSIDGLTWSLNPSNPPATVTRIVYGKSLFVAAGYTGSYYNPSAAILTSSDGVSWQIQFAPPNITISGIAYNAGTFLAISGYGEMFKSFDGTNWVTTGSVLPQVDGGIFSIYYDLNTLSLSYLGHYSILTAYKGTFLAAGLDGILVQSGNLWNPAVITSPQVNATEFSFSYNQQIDVPFHIQSSTDLLNWANVYGGVGTGQPTNFSSPGSSSEPKRFFRIVSP